MYMCVPGEGGEGAQVRVWIVGRGDGGGVLSNLKQLLFLFFVASLSL